MNKKLYHFFYLLFWTSILSAQPKKFHDLQFDSLARHWDEGIPLGNGWLGALIWQRDSVIRISLDRVDLWDDRPMPDIDRLTFSWVVSRVRKNDYDTVHKLGDDPYEKYPAPTKIPGAALEFDTRSLGNIISSELDIQQALSTVRFSSGVLFHQYIHASRQAGYFWFDHLPENKYRAEQLIPQFIMPGYHAAKNDHAGNSVEGQGLERLGYPKGTLVRSAGSILYHQPTWNNHYYEVLVRWKPFSATKWVGEWTIMWDQPAVLPALNPAGKDPTGWDSHVAWWKNYWERSSVSIPDSLLEKQYYLEMYKFGCVARSNTPPISLQAIWTADNGNLPPWKGDIHNDLNTELSYWPGYTANHLDLTASYTHFLWSTKPENERWTKKCFETTGLNVPGVTTISGKPMGGWIQYSLSPTTVCWLAQHFYWQWKYSMDQDFFYTRLKPYYAEVKTYLSGIINKETHQLPLSSSPEINDNRQDAWFTNFSNYDLSLCRYTVRVINEIARRDTARHAMTGMDEKFFPFFDVNKTGLMVAPGLDLEFSHRHLSPYMAIYPLCLLDIHNSADSVIIKNSLRHIENLGTRQWCGYTFSWMSCLYARAGEADNAVRQLKIFASNFCSPNSFHLNGDQKGGQYSSFTYRPFTLEGNFAFAQGVHELLLQSHQGVLEVFPAVPREWKQVAFKTLRAEGAFLVSAKKQNDRTEMIEIYSEQGGSLRLKLPFDSWSVRGVRPAAVRVKNGIADIQTSKGQRLIFYNTGNEIIAR